MYAVKSKYKNPDKYIKGLRDTIKQQEAWISEDWKRRRELQGEVIVIWQDDPPRRKTCTSSCVLGNLHVGDKIAMIGRIVKVVESACNAGNHESYIDYKLLETRRIKE